MPFMPRSATRSRRRILTERGNFRAKLTRIRLDNRYVLLRRLKKVRGALRDADSNMINIWDGD
jgi:hypothetical protein